MFFYKYNDPSYVRREKLEIIIRLCNDRNIDPILFELKEHASEVNVDFIRKSVYAIGRCAIMTDEVSGRCLNVLLDLIDTKVNYVAQVAIIVNKIFSETTLKRNDAIVPTFCQDFDSLDEPEAKGSDEEKVTDEDSPSASEGAASAPNDAIEDLLDLDFGLSPEPTYTSPPV
ncbi:hypothetical protein BG011_003345 [Mortierella polycephala]|uniref:Clathrin/coatomer adaptor adaptin-like N-terminal domain-containing protein n=1 Tax=Mortierella polycephala TaxID=41804 RepID=A0A9P6Q4K8_9FUNG|nr:hypothetical protein BG011_003345 [Mortierella polycephala]